MRLATIADVHRTSAEILPSQSAMCVVPGPIRGTQELGKPVLGNTADGGYSSSANHLHRAETELN